MVWVDMRHENKGVSINVPFDSHLSILAWSKATIPSLLVFTLQCTCNAANMHSSTINSFQKGEDGSLIDFVLNLS